MKLKSNPRRDGFYMPGEYEPHQKTVIIWPQRPDIWRNGGREAQEVFARVANTIAGFEPVLMLVNEDQYDNARTKLLSQVQIAGIASDDSWCRDTGATFVKNERGVIRGIDWGFNAWGGLKDGLYYPWDKDSLVAEGLCELEQVDTYSPENFVLEGGAIHVDGDKTAIVTEECLLSEGRNPRLSKDEIEGVLKHYLNVDQVIWLKYGIYNDETNGHVDNICCFVRPQVVVLAWTEDTEDPQYERSRSCYDILREAVDAKGRRLEIHKLNLPRPITVSKEESEGLVRTERTRPRKAGDRLAASYVNYYVCNGAVIMPGFDDPMDQPAKEKLQQLYPDRKVIQIDTREILLGGGNIHCITQQIPAL